MRFVAVLMVLVLAGCGGSKSEDLPDEPAKSSAKPKDSPPASSKPKQRRARETSPPATQNTQIPEVSVPAGKPAPEALSRFYCAKNAEGAWKARGTVTNSAKSARSFQVSVYVGEVTEGEIVAATQRITSVPAGKAVTFTVNDIVTSTPDGSCHVQLLALKDSR